MAFDDHRARPGAPPRNLRRVGVIAVVAAIAIAAFGILERRSHEAEVTQRTLEQAIPTVAVITPKTGATTQRLVLPGTVQAWYDAYAQVDFDLPSNPNVVHIPTSSLIFREHGLEVAVVGPDNKIELRPVIIGRNLGTQVEVVKGLASLDRIVNSPPDSLANGDTVRVAGESSGSNENLGRAGGETAAASEPKEH